MRLNSLSLSLSLIDTFNINGTEYKHDDLNTGILLDYLASTDDVTIRLNVPIRESVFSFLNLKGEEEGKSRSIYRVDDEIAKLLKNIETTLGQDRSTLVKRIPAPVESNYINVIFGPSRSIENVPITLYRNGGEWRVTLSEDNIDHRGKQGHDGETEDTGVKTTTQFESRSYHQTSESAKNEAEAEAQDTELRPLKRADPRRDIPYGRRLNARD